MSRAGSAHLDPNDFWEFVQIKSLFSSLHIVLWTIINLRTRREAGSSTPCCLDGHRVTIRPGVQRSRLSFGWLSFHIVLLAVHLNTFIYVSFGHVGSSRCWGFSLVAACMGCFLVVVRGLLISVAFLLRSAGSRHPGFSSVAHGPSSCGTWA